MSQETEGTAPETGAGEKEENPFEGFTSESFHDGERLEDEPEDDAGEDDGEEEEEKPAKPEKKTSAQADGDEGDDDDDSSEDDEEDDEGEYSKRVQKRIGKLTRLRKDAERKNRELELEVARLKGRQEAAPPEKKEEAPVRGEETPADKSAKGPPDPKAYKYGELDSRYISDLAKHEARLAVEADRKEREQSAETQRVADAHAEARRKFEKQVEEGKKKYDDYDELVVEGMEAGDWSLSREMAEMLVESEVGHEIAYHLASNPEESDRVFAQTPIEQARYFGKLEAKFMTARETPKPEKKTPKAPPPPSSGARGAGGKFAPSASTDDFSKFEQLAKDSGVL